MRKECEGNRVEGPNGKRPVPQLFPVDGSHTSIPVGLDAEFDDLAQNIRTVIWKLQGVTVHVPKQVGRKRCPIQFRSLRHEVKIMRI